jgi:hypothetical protein
MSTSTQTFSLKERDLLEEIENRAWEYVFEVKATPDVALLSSDLFTKLIQQQCLINRHEPTLHVSKNYERWIYVATFSGTICVEECDKFGSDFLFVGKKADIFPKEGDYSLTDKLLLGENK